MCYNKLINVEGIGQILYNLKDNLSEDVNLSLNNPELCKEMIDKYKDWEKGVITLMLWNKGIWYEVTQETHIQFMDNKKVTVFIPHNLNK